MTGGGPGEGGCPGGEMPQNRILFRFKIYFHEIYIQLYAYINLKKHHAYSTKCWPVYVEGIRDQCVTISIFIYLKPRIT